MNKCRQKNQKNLKNKIPYERTDTLTFLIGTMSRKVRVSVRSYGILFLRFFWFFCLHLFMFSFYKCYFFFLSFIFFTFVFHFTILLFSWKISSYNYLFIRLLIVVFILFIHLFTYFCFYFAVKEIKLFKHKKQEFPFNSYYCY